MGIDIKIVESKVINKKNNKTLVVAQMENCEEKKKINVKKSILKGTPIFIDEDTTFEERRMQRKIKKQQKRNEEETQ